MLTKSTIVFGTQASTGAKPTGGLTPGQRHQLLVEWNDTRWEPDLVNASFNDLFEAQVERTPDVQAIADITSGASLTFRELNLRANLVAHRLLAAGLGVEHRVGLFAHRSLDLVAGVLGILKAGCVYVPLDPEYPADRLAFILGDADLRAVLTHPSLSHHPFFHSLSHHRALEIIDLHAVVQKVSRREARNPQETILPESAAYTIYTSGSTGNPKGVVIPHRALTWYTLVAARNYGLNQQDRVLQFSAISFDISVEEIFPTLACGATLILRSDSMSSSAKELFRRSREWSITVFTLPTAFWHLSAIEVIRQPTLLPRTLRLVILGGERVHPGRVFAWQRAVGSKVQLLNTYGPTETTVVATLCDLSHASRGMPVEEDLPIGRPIPGVTTYVRRPVGKAAKITGDGELLLAGAGIARGYLNQPGKTAECFLPHPWSEEPGRRLYRTGDRARFRSDGQLDYLGRLDDQIKIHGYRVEPSEIESLLLGHPGIQEAAVVAQEQSTGDRRLLAYVVAETEGASASPSATDLRGYLKAKLPPYMLPAQFVFLDEMPLDPNGKLDRSLLALGRLTAASALETAPRKSIAPRTPTEKSLAAVWSEVLRVESICVHDNVFELGTDSIINLQVVARAREKGLRLTPKEIFDHPTIASLAAIVSAKRRDRETDEIPTDESAQEPVTGPIALTPIQRWYFHDCRTGNPWHFNQSIMLEVRRPLDIVVLQQAVRLLIEHHDALRLRFHQEDGEWRQVGTPISDQPPPFVAVDLSKSQRSSLPLTVRAVASRLQASLDLVKGPVLRVAYFNRGPLPARLCIVIHHLAVDGVSWRILVADLENLYLALEASRKVSLPPKTTSFRAWSELLHRQANTPETLSELSYWTHTAQPTPHLPVDFPDLNAAASNTEASEGRITVELDAESTRHLLRFLPAVYRTQINDVLLSALALSFRNWTDHHRLLIELEGHGREYIAEGVDLSQTVGWFTSAFPVTLDIEGLSAPGEVLKAIKEQLREIPRRGFGYPLLRYLCDDPEVSHQMARLPAPQVNFNYLGQSDPHFVDSVLFAHAAEPTGSRSSRTGFRDYIFEVAAYVADERLWVTWSYSGNLHQRSTVEDLATDFLAQLKALIAHCLEPTAGGFTKSDFPLARLTTEELAQCIGSDRNVEDIYPLTPVQHGILFHTLYSPKSSVYFEQSSWSLRGPLHTDAFRHAWEWLQERHSILRTSFLSQGLKKPMQVVRLQAPLPWVEDDWTHLPPEEQAARLKTRLLDDRQVGFELSEAPLMRCQLIRLAESSWRFIWSVHHLILDGWSISLLFEELFQYYYALTQGIALERPRPRPFRDYVSWLSERNTSESELFWRSYLQGFRAPSPLPFSLGKDDGYFTDQEPGYGQCHLSPEATSDVLSFARGHRLTLGLVVQAAWGFLLGRLSGQDDVVFGTTFSGRPTSLSGADEIVGILVNTLPIRVRLPLKSPAITWLKELQEQNVQIGQHQYSALVDIHGWSEITSPEPLFRSAVGFQNYPGESGLRERHDRLELDDLEYFSMTSYPLVIEVIPDEELWLQARYDRLSFQASSISLLLRHLGTVLQNLAALPTSPLGALTTLTAAERHQILHEWSGPEVTYPKERRLHTLFEQQVRRSPEKTAILCPALHSHLTASATSPHGLSYRELNDRALALASLLRRKGIRSDQIVALFLERSCSMVVAFLGVLKAGGAYLPIDPETPSKRLAHILQDSEASLVLTESAWSPRLPEAPHLEVVCMDTEWEDEPTTALTDLTTGDHLAYVLYTSGSTGRPKGVMISHEAIGHHMHWMQDRLPLSEEDRVLQKTPYTFDASVWEFYAPLFVGAQVVLARSGAHRDPAEMIDAIKRLRITVLQVVPTQLRMLLGEPEFAECIHLRRVCCGGEALSPDLKRRFTETGLLAELVNVYGPTEGSIHATSYRCQPRKDEPLFPSLPIGRPISNTRTLPLYRDLRPVPVGVAGELMISGPGLGRGYLQAPALTASRFLPDPYSDAEGSRIYRTGDLARYLGDGNLVYLGRIDRQTKVRGFRIELGEIEHALQSHPAVQEAVVTAWATEDKETLADTRLAAYVVRQAKSTSTLASREESFVSRWLTLYENLHSERSVPGQDGKAVDLVSWKSVYDDKPVPVEQMLEWISPTVERILELQPRRVLEIGCGTGLLLLRIAPHCEFYHGTDFSLSIVKSLQSRIGGRPLANVEVSCQTADDLSGVALGSFDTVVINSVSQYFPSADYLVRVLRRAEEALSPGGKIFVGDVPSLPQLELYSASIELFRAGAELTLDELSERIGRRQRLSENLLVHPDFFFAYQKETPRLKYVHIEPRGGRTRNELTRFAFDTVLHFDLSNRSEETNPSSNALSLDYQRDGLSLQSIAELLEEAHPRLVSIRRLPDVRLSRESRLLELLRESSGEKTVAHLRAALNGDGGCGVEPDDLRAVCRARGYLAELRGPDYGSTGTFDVCLRPAAVAPVAVPADRELLSWDAYTNSPFSAQDDTEFTASLRRHLAELLPDFMCPAAYVVVASIPRLPSGKTDRRALPRPESAQGDSALAAIAPRNETEETLTEIWKEVLGLSAVGVEQNFFDLGGHSLLATQAISRIRTAFRLEIALRKLFELPTIEQLAQHVDSLRSHTTAKARSLTAMEVVPPTGPPLSFAQQRLWFLHQMTPHSIAYNMTVEPWRMKGRLHVAALQGALREIIRRHQVLRTIFPSVDGIPRQEIVNGDSWTLPVVDLEALPMDRRWRESRRLTWLLSTQPFPLEKGPLLRVALVRIDEVHHILSRTAHHIVSDGWSEAIFYDEIGKLYSAILSGCPSPLPELPIQYVDFATWQRRTLQGEYLDRQLSYWRHQLKDLPRLNLPGDRARPAVQKYVGGVTNVRIPGEVTAELRKLSREAKGSLFITLLTAFMCLLRRYTGQNDVAVGSPIANRTHEEVEKLIGFFVNTLVLRGRVDRNLPFRSFLEQVRDTALEAYAHQDLPFERLVEELQPERELNRNPLFQVSFALQNVPQVKIVLEGLDVELEELDFEPVAVDLVLHLWEEPDHLHGYLLYDTDLFDASRMSRLSGHFQCLLRELSKYPESKPDEASYLSAPERHQLLQEWNDTSVSEAGDRGFLALFDRQVLTQAGKDALRFQLATGEETRLSYRQLDDLANRFGGTLRARPELGAGSEKLVALALERTPQAIIAILGALKAGFAFLPLDPSYPPERLSFMIRDSRAALLVTRREVLERFPNLSIPVFLLDEFDLTSVTPSQMPAPLQANPDRLAYVIFTSGSTGRPKGSMLHHLGLFNLAADRHLGTRPEDVVLQFASLSFDASVSEIAMTLAAGATLDLGIAGRHPAGGDFTRLLAERRITQVILPPSALAACPPEAATQLPDLRTILVAGEACRPDLPAIWGEAAGREFRNAYGPTEATVCASVSRFPGKGRRLSIGRPITSFRLFVLDSRLNLQAAGLPGELHLAGLGLARGYLGRPGLTAERFLPHPFPLEPGERLYKTGDLARYLGDGNVDLVGRVDSQVKIRGFRIELGEVEAALRRLAAVRDAVVETFEARGRDGSDTDRQLVAYVVPSEEAAALERSSEKQLASWQAVYEELHSRRDGASEQDPRFDIQGWNSSLTGQAIPEAEMREWVENTVDRIFAARDDSPGCVLELGCGTGLLLWRIAPRARRYLGTDFSLAVIDRLASQLSMPGKDLAQVELRHQAADDRTGIRPEAFDLVILNSVIQYFPSVEYLLDVLEGAVEAAAAGGVVFLGDIRSLPLYEAFCTSMEAAQADPTIRVAALREKIAGRRLREKEMVIDPRFFTELPRLLSRIRSVQVLPKLARARNEMSCFRYDVVLRLDEAGGSPGGSAPDSWWTWRDDMTVEAIRRELESHPDLSLGVRRIPDARVARDVRLLQLVGQADDATTVEELLESSAAGNGVEPADLEQVARDAGATLEWLDDGFGHDGRYDVVFWRSEPPRRVAARPSAPDESSRPDWHSWVNDPLASQKSRQLVSDLRRQLETQLPSFMIPGRILLLPELPLLPNGKIDRKRLPAPDQRLVEPTAPRTSSEKDLLAIWNEVLGVDGIGIHDNFFECGGHSLNATQVQSRIEQTFRVLFPLRRLFEHPTIAQIAACLAETTANAAQSPREEFEEFSL